MKQVLIEYTLHLADDSLILGQRNAEWCGHGPVLEQDIAITNISLDLIGQARNFYQYAATLIGNDATEDSLAYLRKEEEFKNCLLVEQPKGDWAQTILRQFLFSQYQYLLFQQLQNSKDEQLAAIAEKSLKEVTYHLRWSSEWVIRLGDGTDESHQRMIKAIEELWKFTDELFSATNYELQITSDGSGVDISKLKEPWMNKVKEIFSEATLTIPGKTLMQTGGKEGKHTDQLASIFTELQYMQRTYPGCDW
ncbi:MAG TPA: 1,2-phenylacetyl-CoA epoxidase subunit PaaC [Chitinophagaceae bacterium]|nr:1,2-phenylacetyl-CoA epoxidase subunit PaaC [Chitinophagaceae bacterium]